MTYEEAYKKIYEYFVGWKVSIDKMTPSNDYSEDRIFGMQQMIGNVVNEMECLTPEIKIIREETETWKDELDALFE